jgi:hypothetical protein
MAIWNCKECPYLTKKSSGLFGSYYHCSKFETKREYSQKACAEMKGK